MHLYEIADRYKLIDIDVADTEIKQRKITVLKLKELGVDIYSVDGLDEHENPYRAEAIMLITNGEDVPEELKQKIQEYDAQNKGSACTSNK